METTHEVQVAIILCILLSRTVELGIIFKYSIHYSNTNAVFV